MNSEERARQIVDGLNITNVNGGGEVVEITRRIVAAIDAAVAEERKLYNAAWAECMARRNPVGYRTTANYWDPLDRAVIAHNAARRAAGLEVER